MKAKRLIGILVLGLGSTLALLSGLQMAQAATTATNRFVKPTGGGSACTQMTPCALQTALGQAVDGDTLYMAGGVYTGTGGAVITVTKSITLAGGWDGLTGTTVVDPAAYPTTLNGEGARRVVYIIGDITPTLDGLRITNGWANVGGGIFAYNAHPIVNGCQVYSNSATYGGGIYLNGSNNARLTGNLSYSNVATGTSSSGGGGVYMRFSAHVTLANNQVFSNSSVFNGGGVYIENSPYTQLTSNQIFSNTTLYYGGIVIVSSPTATLTGNRIHHNIATGEIGGLGIGNSDGCTLIANQITHNTATSYAGGIQFYGIADAILVNNVIADNSAGSCAGFSIRGSYVQLLHTTIARNTGGDGTGVCLSANPSDSSIAMTNTILVSHTIGIRVDANCTATLAATLWGNGEWANAVESGGAGSISTGTINIRELPVFAGSAAGDYHLGPGSAAINQGIPTWLMSDMDGDPRIGLPDIGADEYIPAHSYLPLALRND
jgi:parallel beta-helix repeat protein